ncbi:MAG: hypothetical protein DHS80DRAFT_23699 [Piptocephalis tieghemiana]|nr:MAG: hypothetical protein DHS80DRAFT_23699 [Piptocephalis tieghemiana]
MSPASLITFILAFLISISALIYGCHRYIHRQYDWKVPSAHLLHSLLVALAAVAGAVISLCFTIPHPEDIGQDLTNKASTWLMGLCFQAPPVLIVAAQCNSLRTYQNLTMRRGAWVLVIIFLFCLISSCCRMSVSWGGPPGDVAIGVLSQQYTLFAYTPYTNTLLYLCTGLDGLRIIFFGYAFITALRSQTPGMYSAIACPSLEVLSLILAQITMIKWLVLIIPLSWAIQSSLSVRFSLELHAKQEPPRRLAMGESSFGELGGLDNWNSKRRDGGAHGRRREPPYNSHQISTFTSFGTCTLPSHIINSPVSAIDSEATVFSPDVNRIPSSSIPKPNPVRTSSSHEAMREVRLKERQEGVSSERAKESASGESKGAEEGKAPKGRVRPSDQHHSTMTHQGSHVSRMASTATLTIRRPAPAITPPPPSHMLPRSASIDSVLSPNDPRPFHPREKEPRKSSLSSYPLTEESDQGELSASKAQSDPEIKKQESMGLSKDRHTNTIRSIPSKSGNTGGGRNLRSVEEDIPQPPRRQAPVPPSETDQRLGVDEGSTQAPRASRSFCPAPPHTSMALPDGALGMSEHGVYEHVNSMMNWERKDDDSGSEDFIENYYEQSHHPSEFKGIGPLSSTRSDMKGQVRQEDEEGEEGDIWRLSGMSYLLRDGGLGTRPGTVNLGKDRQSKAVKKEGTKSSRSGSRTETLLIDRSSWWGSYTETPMQSPPLPETANAPPVPSLPISKMPNPRTSSRKEI